MVSPTLDNTALLTRQKIEDQSSSIDFDQLYKQLVRLPGKKRYIYWFVKRAFDIMLSVIALLCLSPLFLILAILICIDDPYGGPIYSQIRIGHKGKPFRFYKFRSMVVGADQMLEQLKDRNEGDGPTFKMKNDPRITRVGKIIRRCSLDELPQFWNVLKGDMSLVGPRPALPSEVEQYTEYQMRRLLVTPGLTCYWQTQPKRNEIPFNKWVELDLQYIKKSNFWVDLKLILKTIVVMVRREGL